MGPKSEPHPKKDLCSSAKDPKYKKQITVNLYYGLSVKCQDSYLISEQLKHSMFTDTEFKCVSSFS